MNVDVMDRPRPSASRRLAWSRRATCVAAVAWLSVAPALGHPPSPLTLRVGDGTVSVTARDVSPAAILARWADAGGVTIVNAANVPDAPATSLDLTDVPEGTLLNALLGDVVGYIVTLRPGPYQAGTSIYDRLFVMRTSRVAEALSAPREELTSLNLPNGSVDVLPLEELTSVSTAAVDVDTTRVEKTVEAAPANTTSDDAGAPTNAAQARTELVAPAAAPPPGTARELVTAPGGDPHDR